jgi:hypothetical protein
MSIPKIIALIALTALCLCAKGQYVYETNIYRTNGYPVTHWETNKIWFTNEQELEDRDSIPAVPQRIEFHKEDVHATNLMFSDGVYATNIYVTNFGPTWFNVPGGRWTTNLAEAAYLVATDERARAIEAIERADEARDIARQALWSARASLAILLSTFLSIIFLYWKSGRETK